MHSYLKPIISALLGTAFLAAAAAEPIPGDADRAAAARWADSVYNTLSERQRLAQLIFPKVAPTAGANSKATIRRYAEAGMGGLLFSEGTLEQYVDMTNYAQSKAEVPLMMTFDGEWGLAMRIKELPKYPCNMALGAIRNPRLIYDYGREMARECRLLGIQCNFAPDADVNSNPANPVIGYRAFGEDPQRVANATVAYTLGMEDAGVQATPKHFPGHGDTSTDTHKTVTTVSHTAEQMRQTDIVPFSEAIKAGGSAIMVGHLVVPSLDSSLYPASLSHAMTTDFLRGEMGFEGLIYTDALGMRGAVDPEGRNPAVAAMTAGADVLLCPDKPMTALDALVAAKRTGSITEAMLADRCKRLLRYKYYLGLNVRPHVDTDIDSLRAEIASPEAEALIQRLADASITVTKNEGGILPIGNLASTKIAVVTVGGAGDGNPAATFEAICRHYADVQTFHSNGGVFSATSMDKIKSADIVILAIFKGDSQQLPAAQQIAGAGISRLVSAFMVQPYRMRKFAAAVSNAKAVVLSYDNLTASARAAAQACFGGIAVDGTMPVNLAGIAPLGAGIRFEKTRLGFTSPVAEGFRPWLTDSVDAFVRRVIRAGGMPGCQVLVARNGNIVLDKAYGTLSGAGSEAVTAQTVYDLASVSKAMGTLPGIMKAYDQGLIALEDTLGALIPEIADSAKQCISVRQLLYHETGMPAALNMFNVMIDSTSYTGQLIKGRRDAMHPIKIQRGAWGHRDGRLRRDITSATRSERFPIEADRGIYTGRETYDTLMHRIYDIPLRENRDYNYSCLNFCLLMDIEQRRTGRSHDEFTATEIFGPLGAYGAGYRPTERFPLTRIAPTERDTYLRRQLVHGYVHDELANFSGGVQGNAGLFGSADDLAKVCQMLLNGGTYGDARILSEETARLFTTDKSPTCRRGLGFDKPDTENPDYSPTCDEAGASVFGHLGFTGTCFWVDPSENMIFVFLTNRVYPTRDSAVFNRSNVRPHLFSLVYQALNNGQDNDAANAETRQD